MANNNLVVFQGQSLVRKIMICEVKSMRLIQAIFLQYCSGTNFGTIDLLIYNLHLQWAYSQCRFAYKEEKREQNITEEKRREENFT